MQDDIDEAKRLLEEAYLEVQAAEQSDRSSMRGGRGDGRNGQDQKPDGSDSGISQSMETISEKRLLGGIKKTKNVEKIV